MPVQDTPQPTQPPSADPPLAASRAEKAARDAPDDQITPQEKRVIGAETSREEDA